MNAPALVMTPGGKWTVDSLREHYRHKVSHIDGMDRHRYAYAVLSEIALRGGFTPGQVKAIAEGLELGMTEGVR